MRQQPEANDFMTSHGIDWDAFYKELADYEEAQDDKLQYQQDEDIPEVINNIDNDDEQNE